jgi:hypothetical protein
MTKPKTIKPVLAWGVWTPRYGIFPLTKHRREDARNSTYMDNEGAEIIRVEIRDAATAKLRDAVIEAAKKYRETLWSAHLDKLMQAIDALAAHEANKVRK